MSTNVQNLLLDLINDMSQSQGLKSSTLEILQGQKEFISGKKIIQEGNETREIAVKEVANQKRKIGFFLEGIFDTFRAEDPLNFTGIDDVYNEMGQINSTTGPKNSGDRILAALKDAQFYEHFLGLFDKKITSQKRQEPYNIFPSITENPDNLEKFKLLLQFCVTADDLECLEIKRQPVIKSSSSDESEFDSEEDSQSEFDSQKSSHSESESDLEFSQSDSDIILDDSLFPKNTNTSYCSPISMMVLGGFIAVLGIAAIATAFALLMGTGLGAAVVIGGAAAVLAGATSLTIGFFKHKQEKARANEYGELDQLYTDYLPPHRSN